MKLEFRTEKLVTLPDKSREILLDIRPEQQVFIGYLLEGLEGLCYHTIVDYNPNLDNLTEDSESRDTLAATKSEKLMKITVTSDSYETVMEFLANLQGYII